MDRLTRRIQAPPPPATDLTTQRSSRGGVVLRFSKVESGLVNLYSSMPDC